MKKTRLVFVLRSLVTVMAAFFVLAGVVMAGAGGPKISEATQNCLECHAEATPGIVADWEKSRHATTSPARESRISAKNIPADLTKVVVGCAECHTINPDTHADTFDHEGEGVHVIVSPKDCATCHITEAREYGANKMAHAHGILTKNALYKDLMDSINSEVVYTDGKLVRQSSDSMTEADSCLFCHGTKISVKGRIIRETDFGEMEFPVLEGWPNQGVGRINPDKSMGSCSSCHTRHRFSIKTARQPYTCSQCHKGPDVPAYGIYTVSKHGNIFASHKNEWDFDAVPWTVGRDFSAPTCAVCHMSEVMDKNGQIVAKRTHQANDRLAWRLVGLVYAHPQPENPDTSIIKNRAGLPLPTELTGEFVSEFLIDEIQMANRNEIMQNICLSCHSNEWVKGHWKRFEHSIKTTNARTLAATRIIMKAWDKGVAKGPDQGASPFDEAIEKKWVRQWLLYANSTRMASAMGGADYGVFAGGRWNMSQNLADMYEFLERSLSLKCKGGHP